MPPFSSGRMTWIKPSFRWSTHRGNFGRKSGQERIPAVRITRAGWEEALAAGALTSGDQVVLARADVHVQWDPERSLRGAALNEHSIQVGLGRGVIRSSVEEWTVGITDLTERTRKIADLLRSGKTAQVHRLPPPERLHPADPVRRHQPRG